MYLDQGYLGDAENARLEFSAQTRSKMQGVENASKTN